nr:putative ribonuclease H-like domain-containing protein [Tanacetum cinerariifolium]
MFMNKKSDLENTSVNDRYAAGMHAVPPPMTGNYMPFGPDIEIDYSKFTYGPKQTSVDESTSKLSKYAYCESDSSVETTTSMPEPEENARKVICEPKVWTDAPIIEEYESISDNDSDYPHKALKDKGIVDSGCSRHMTGNKAHLDDYQDFKGGSVTFGGSNERITCKEKIKAGKLDFQDVQINSYVKSVRADSQSLLSWPYKRPCVAFLSDKQHRRINVFEIETVHIVLSRKFKEYLILIRALKDKQIVNSGCSKHMTGNKAHLADYQEFKGGSVAFGGSNGRITGKGKIKDGMLKGIKREYSNAITPQQNEVAKRKNRTLIEAARTMLADSFLPTTFWAEAVNIACYVLNRVLVTKPQNKTPYELLTEHQANKSAGSKEANNGAGTQANDDQSANSKEIDLHEEHFILSIGSAYSTTVKSSGDKIEKNTDFKTSESLRKEATYDIQNANTSSTNLLNTVSTPLSTVDPLRAFNDGELSYPDDPSMPHLEDIYASPSEGIFTDSSYNDEAIHTRSKVNKNFEAHALVKERPRKGQNRIKTGQKREAWRSREKSKAVTVDKGRKTEQNKKRMAVNANTVKRSSSKLARDQTSNPTFSANPTPKGRIRRSSKQKVENSHFEKNLTPVDTMTDNRTMAEMLRAPTEGCAEAIVVPPILADQFELKHSLINMMTSEQFFGLEKDNPHDHVRWMVKH